jgi:transcriptional regulator with XRE-family HTH domain
MGVSPLSPGGSEASRRSGRGVDLIERGKRMPRFDTLLKLAGARGIEPGEFFPGACAGYLIPGRKGRFEES